MILQLAACATLDAFVFNPIHCSIVTEDTCTAYDNAWDNACVPCKEPYDWSIDYPWTTDFPAMLRDGETIRAVDDALLTLMTLETDDGAGELDAYWVASHGDNADLATVTVLYSHGNYLGIEHYMPRVRALHEVGVNVLVWDYRGFGKSQPDTVPTPEQHLADARLAMATAFDLAPDPARVVSYGYSVGSLAATEAAGADGVCALVLESPFTSLARVARSNSGMSFGERFFSSGDWDNFERMESWKGPALGMVGTLDEKFPPDDVTDLVNTGSGPRELWVVDGAHHDISSGAVVEADFDAWSERLLGFLDDQGCL